MARGRGDDNNLAVAPTRGGSASIASRLQDLSTRLESRAQNMETHAKAWQQMKMQKVSLADRVMLRIRSRWSKIIVKNDEHLLRLAEIRQQQLAARDAYMMQGLSNDTPMYFAWQAAMVYAQRSPMEVEQEVVPELIAVEDHPVLKTTENKVEPVIEPVIEKKVEKAIEEPIEEVAPPAPQVQEKPVKKKEVSAPPSQLGGVPLPDVVPHEADDELGVEIPQLMGDGKEDDEMAKWLAEFEQWDEYHSVTRGENDIKRKILANMLFAYHSNPAVARENLLKADDFINVMAESGVSSSQAASLFWVMRHDPEKMQRALRTLAPDGVPVDQRINNFCMELGDVQNAFYRYKGPNAEGYIGLQSDEKQKMTDGAKLALASVLLFAIHGEKTPPYRNKMATGGYHALGIKRPQSLPTVKQKAALEAAGKPVYPTPGDMYVHYMGLLDTVASKMDARGRRGADRLAGFEALLWTIDGPKWHKLSMGKPPKARFPKWPAQKARSFLAWSDKVRKR